jgi:hypothetical protein
VVVAAPMERAHVWSLRPALSHTLGCQQALFKVHLQYGVRIEWKLLERVDGDQDRTRECVDVPLVVSLRKRMQDRRLMEVGQRDQVLCRLQWTTDTQSLTLYLPEAIGRPYLYEGGVRSIAQFQVLHFRFSGCHPGTCQHSEDALNVVRYPLAGLG